MKSPDVENLLETLGQPGKLQSISFFFLCINLWIVMTNHMASVFFAAKTEYSCKVDRNITSQTSPFMSSHDNTDNCYILVNNSSEKCTAWNYNLPEGETTIISEVEKGVERINAPCYCRVMTVNFFNAAALSFFMHWLMLR